MLRTLFNRRMPGAGVSPGCRGFGAAGITIACLLSFFLAASAAETKEPRPFKPFKLKTLDGQRKTLEDFPGRLTLIGFFYPRCPYCRVSVPKLQGISERYKSEGLTVLLINVVEDEDKIIPSFMRELGITLPVLTGAWQPSLMRDYDLEATPTHFLIDGKGKVLFRQNGYNPGDEKILDSRISVFLGETAKLPANPAIH